MAFCDRKPQPQPSLRFYRAVCIQAQQRADVRCRNQSKFQVSMQPSLQYSIHSFHSGVHIDLFAHRMNSEHHSDVQSTFLHTAWPRNRLSTGTSGFQERPHKAKKVAIFRWPLSSILYDGFESAVQETSLVQRAYNTNFCRFQQILVIQMQV